MIQVPNNIELIYFADHIEFVKDGNPDKPLSPKEKKICDKVVELISKLAGIRRGCMSKTPIEVKFNVVKRNKYGHRFIEEPVERENFRNKCKHQKLGCLCDKNYYCYIQDSKTKDMAKLMGCTPGVYCPRLQRWDKMHGLPLSGYTMIERKL